MEMNPGMAQIKLKNLDSEAEKLDWTDTFVIFQNKGLPLEITTRLKDLWDMTKDIGGEVVHVGKILVMEILEFVERNPNLTIGLAVGAAIGALVDLIPFFGAMLKPLAMSIGAFIGGVAGTRMDKRSKGEVVEDSFVGIAQDVIYVAKEFFRLIADIINALRNYFSE